MKCYVIMVILMLVFGTVVPNAQAWNEPDSVLGHKWGATRAEVAKADCGDLCFKSFDFGGLSGLAWFYFDPKGGMDAVELRAVRQEEYFAFRGVMFKKYGQPTSIEETEVRTQLGAKFPSEVVTWAGKKVTILLQERCSNITQSCAYISLNSRLDRAEEKKREMIKKGAEGL